MRHRTGSSKQFSLQPLGQRGPRVRRALRSIGMRHEAADIVALGQPCMSSKKSRVSLTRAGQAALQADSGGTLNSRNNKQNRPSQQLIGRIKKTDEGMLVLVVELSRGLGLCFFLLCGARCLGQSEAGIVNPLFHRDHTLLIRRTAD